MSEIYESRAYAKKGGTAERIFRPFMVGLYFFITKYKTKYLAVMKRSNKLTTLREVVGGVNNQDVIYERSFRVRIMKAGLMPRRVEPRKIFFVPSR